MCGLIYLLVGRQEKKRAEILGNVKEGEPDTNPMNPTRYELCKSFVLHYCVFTTYCIALRCAALRCVALRYVA